jgi:serine/threonine protein kinase
LGTDKLDDSQLETRVTGNEVTLDPVERWGPFEDLQRVGRGSFGEVYRAFDPRLQRHVALKLLIASTLLAD